MPLQCLKSKHLLLKHVHDTLWYVATCRTLWYVATCRTLWYVATCRTLWYVATCRTLWYVATCCVDNLVFSDRVDYSWKTGVFQVEGKKGNSFNPAVSIV